MSIPRWFLGSALFCVTLIPVVAIVHQYHFSLEGTPWGSLKLSPSEVEKANRLNLDLCEQQVAIVEDELESRFVPNLTCPE